MREELIERIRALQEELKDLGVKYEHIKFYRMDETELVEVLDSVGRQLETRKRFLGEN